MRSKSSLNDEKPAKLRDLTSKKLGNWSAKTKICHRKVDSYEQILGKPQKATEDGMQSILEGGKNKNIWLVVQ